MRISSLMVVDVIGVLVVAALAGVAVCYGFLNADRASRELQEITAIVEGLQRTTDETKATLQQQTQVYEARRAALGEGDLLPEEIPIENDLRAVSDIARRHRLELIEFSPLGSFLYPGVRETRYRLRAVGRFAQYLRFFRDFERSDSWADITYLELNSSNAQTQDGKAADLVVSLYSATGRDSGEASASDPGATPET
jgi:hypothetical protein